MVIKNEYGSIVFFLIFVIAIAIALGIQWNPNNSQSLTNPIYKAAPLTDESASINSSNSDITQDPLSPGFLEAMDSIQNLQNQFDGLMESFEQLHQGQEANTLNFEQFRADIAGILPRLDDIEQTLNSNSETIKSLELCIQKIGSLEESNRQISNLLAAYAKKIEWLQLVIGALLLVLITELFLIIKSQRKLNILQNEFIRQKERIAKLAMKNTKEMNDAGQLTEIDSKPSEDKQYYGLFLKRKINK